MKDHLGAVVGVGSHLEEAGLGVHGELVKPHGADEGDVGGLAAREPLTNNHCHGAGTLWRHITSLKGLTV